MPYYPFLELVNFSWILVNGFLISFLVISSFTYLKTKLPIFKSYSLYLLFIILYLILKFPFFSSANQDSLAVIHPFFRIFQVMAFYFHVRFSLQFLNLKELKPKLTKRSHKVLNGICITSVVFLFGSFLLQDNNLANTFYFIVFQSIAFIYVIYLLYQAFRTSGELNRYFIIGVGLYMLLVIFSGVTSLLGILYESNFAFNFPPIVIFYVGLTIEIFIFAFGLAKKVELLYTQKVKSDQKLLEVQQNQNLLLTQKIEEKERELKELFHQKQLEQEENLQLKYEAEISNLKVIAFQSQMNPHFIFNVLNSIKLFIIENNTTEAVTYLNKFSKLIRKILTGSQQDKYAIKEEIDFLNLYVAIENMRFNHEIDFTITSTLTQQEEQALKIPPLLLQPFIENAILHGLASKDGEKKLTLKIAKKNLLTIEVIDNGIGRYASSKLKESKAVSSKSIGVDLTTKRLAYFSKPFYNSGKITFQDITGNKNNTGTKVIIEIPY